MEKENDETGRGRVCVAEDLLCSLALALRVTQHRSPSAPWRRPVAVTPHPHFSPWLTLVQPAVMPPPKKVSPDHSRLSLVPAPCFLVPTASVAFPHHPDQTPVCPVCLRLNSSCTISYLRDSASRLTSVFSSVEWGSSFLPYCVVLMIKISKALKQSLGRKCSINMSYGKKNNNYYYSTINYLFFSNA